MPRDPKSHLDLVHGTAPGLTWPNLAIADFPSWVQDPGSDYPNGSWVASVEQGKWGSCTSAVSTASLKKDWKNLYWNVFVYLSSRLYLTASPAGYQRHQRAFLVYLAFQITNNLRSVCSVCSLICLFHFRPDRTFWFLFQASSSAAAAGFLTFS